MNKIKYQLIQKFNRLARASKTKINSFKEEAENSSMILREDGILVIENFVEKQLLSALQKKVKDKIETKLNFETPCLSQKLIDPTRHQELIESKFLLHNHEIEDMGIAFFDKDKSSYEQILRDFEPSTLKIEIMNDPDFAQLILSEKIRAIAEEFFSFTPVLKEAYLRRNFEAKYEVMNHCWHRDQNSNFLLKAFILLSDCNLENGPHHYIKGSANSSKFREPKYYTNEEINQYPEFKNKLFLGTVPAGTLILEDTRGLHKAGMPSSGYRDMIFGVFTPKYERYTDIFKQKNLYMINNHVIQSLQASQVSYIPKT
jgi:hypothetical protein